MDFRKKIFFLIILSSLLLGSTTNSFTLSPTKYLITVAPGSSQTAEVTITNDNIKEETYGLSVVKVEQDDNGRSMISLTKDYIPLLWVKPEMSDINLLPGESEKIKYIIDIPQGAEAGSYYLGLAVYPLVSGNGNVGVNAQLVTVVYLKVAGIVNEALNVSRWQSSKVNFTKNIKFNLTLENSGNMEVDMDAAVSLKSFSGREVESEKKSLGTQLLAGEKREAVISLPSSLKILPGIYHADLNIIYGQTKQIVTSSYTFWYLPWWSLVIILILIFSIGWFVLKKFFKKQKV